MQLEVQLIRVSLRQPGSAVRPAAHRPGVGVVALNHKLQVQVATPWVGGGVRQHEPVVEAPYQDPFHRHHRADQVLRRSEP